MDHKQFVAEIAFLLSTHAGSPYSHLAARDQRVPVHPLLFQDRAGRWSQAGDFMAGPCGELSPAAKYCLNAKGEVQEELNI